MIGKITIGKDFYGVLAYNEKKVSEGVGYVIDSNIEYSTAVNMTQEFNLIRQLRPGLGNAVLHVSLNLPYSDQLDDNEFASLGCDYLMKMGFDNNQFIMYRHTDTEHEHIHIVGNRVRYSGRITSDSNIKRRSREVLNDLERKFGLTQISTKIGGKKSLDQKEIEKTLRTGDVPIKLVLQERIGSAISKAMDTTEFIKLLQEQNISPKFNVSKTTGRVSGISFKYQDVVYKGSTLGKKYSWNSVIKQIGYEQDRDRAVILENNSTVRRSDSAFKEFRRASTPIAGKTFSVTGQTIKTIEQPKSDMGNVETIALKSNQTDDNQWNSFKLELDDKIRFRKKRRKGKGRRL